jgi:hypothetical protein
LARTQPAKTASDVTIGGFIGFSVGHVINPLLTHFGLSPLAPDVTAFISTTLGVLGGSLFDKVSVTRRGIQEKADDERRRDETEQQSNNLRSILIKLEDRQQAISTAISTPTNNLLEVRILIQRLDASGGTQNRPARGS